MRTVRWAAVVVAMSVWGAQAWATVGGPSYVTDVRYDAAARTLYYVRSRFDESGLPPMVAAFRVGDPGERIAHKVTNPSPRVAWQAEAARWQRWERRLAALPRPRASMGAPARVRSLGVREDSLADGCGDVYERRLTLVEVRSGALVGRARVTSYGNHMIHVANLFDVPGGRRVAVLRARGVPIEGGYDEDTVVLLAPPAESGRGGGGVR